MTDCNIKNNINYGICFYGTFDSEITNCTISDNLFGIKNLISYENIIFHNNFLNNENQAEGGAFYLWDNGYPSGGNYWDDYTGNDSDGDGIGDSP